MMTRRLALCLSAIAAGLSLGPRTSHGDAGRLSRTEARRRLDMVNVWGIQYQNVDVAGLAQSPLDMIVLDPSLNDSARRFINPTEMAALKRKPDGSRRLVIGYLCIGEADLKRWYWPPRWRHTPPAWVGPDNPAWPGSRVVRYWDREWQDLIVTGPQSILRRMIEMGFDGALLDRVDAYGDWERQRSSARRDMVDLVEKVAAQARGRHPGFLLIPQNAEHLIADPRYLRAIDAINKESLLTGLAGENIENTPGDVDWSLSRLKQAQDQGIKLFGTEYLSDVTLRAHVDGTLRELDILPFFGVKALNRPPDGV
jgi:cysteinyl-tRNA synthetase